MSKIPPELLALLLADPFYKGCARAGWHDHVCDGKITFEHAIIFGGKQLQEKFAIIPLCEKAHAVNNHQDGGDLNKEINVWIALNRATVDEIRRISKAVNYTHKLKILGDKFGTSYTGPLKTYIPPTQKRSKQEQEFGEMRYAEGFEAGKKSVLTL